MIEQGALYIDELIAALEHKMNLKAIAEGIESARQSGATARVGMRVWTRVLDAKAEQFMLQQAAQARTSEAGTANRKDEDQLQNQKRRT